jgi:hypothetical protein
MVVGSPPGFPLVGLRCCAAEQKNAFSSSDFLFHFIQQEPSVAPNAKNQSALRYDLSLTQYRSGF